MNKSGGRANWTARISRVRALVVPHFVRETRVMLLRIRYEREAK
jgi:hypothetical protein